MQSIPVASEGIEIGSQYPWRDRGGIERERDPLVQIGKREGKGWVGSPNLAYIGELRSRWKQEVEDGGLDDDDDENVCVAGGAKTRWRCRIASALMAISSWTRALRVALLLLLVVAIVAAFFTLPVEKILKDFLVWIDTNLGPWGPLVLAVAYIPLTILAVPASILTLGGGYLFGLPIGFVADSVGATIGAVAAFLLGRTIGRPYVLARLKDYPKFQAVAIAVESSGFKIVLLLRLVPLLPFNMMNYLLSVTPVSLGQYMLASWLGMMPITLALVYVGTTLKDLSDVTHGWSEISTGRLVFLASSVVVSGILMVCVTKVAKNALEKALAENSNTLSLNSPQLPSTSDLSLDLHQPLVIRVDPSSEDGREK